jgi:hypothetical protein
MEIKRHTFSISTLNSIVIFMLRTESRGRGVTSPASYLGGPRFKSQLGDRLSWLMVFVTITSPSRKIPGHCLKLSNDRFLSHSSPFVIHLSPFNSKLYNLSYWNASLNKLQINKFSLRPIYPLCLLDRWLSGRAQCPCHKYNSSRPACCPYCDWTVLVFDIR